jgi:hypothetical protein
LSARRRWWAGPPPTHSTPTPSPAGPLSWLALFTFNDASAWIQPSVPGATISAPNAGTNPLGTLGSACAGISWNWLTTSPNGFTVCAAPGATEKYPGGHGTPIRAVMLPRLGPNVWHDTPGAAMATLEELEETARLMVLQPQTIALTEQELQNLRDTFGARW